jgi:hypothetical protein
MGIVGFFTGAKWLGRKADYLPPLVQSLMSGATPLLPLRAFMVSIRTTSPFVYLYLFIFYHSHNTEILSWDFTVIYFLINVNNAYRLVILILLAVQVKYNRSYKCTGHFQDSEVCNSKGPALHVPRIHFLTHARPNFSEKNMQKYSACLEHHIHEPPIFNIKWFQSIYLHVHGHTMEKLYTIILQTQGDHIHGG